MVVYAMIFGWVIGMIIAPFITDAIWSSMYKQNKPDKPKVEEPKEVEQIYLNRRK